MLRKQIAFDHCFKADALSATFVPSYDWMSGSGYSIGVAGQGGNLASAVISADGWLAFGLTASWFQSSSAYTYVDINSGPAPSATKLVLGLRIRSFTTYSSADDVIQLGNSTGGTYQPILTFADVVAIRGTTVASGSPVEMYLEIVIDNVAKTREIWANGVFVKSVALTLNATNITALTGGNVRLQLRQALWVGPVTQNWYRDIYLTDDVAGDGMVGRLGPQRMIPIYLDQATGPWVSDDGLLDLKATLNAALPAAAQVVSPTDKTPLTLSLAAAVPDGYKLNAVNLFMSGKSLGDVPTNTKVEVKQGGVTLPAVNVTVPRTTTYALPLGSWPLAPDAGPWTLTKLDQTSIVITPDQ